MFKTVVKNAGVQHLFDIDSCGTGGGNPEWYEVDGWSYHEGDPSDPRMKEAANRRGVDINSKSRPLNPEDIGRFDYIIAMDAKNIAAMKVAIEYWKPNASIPKNYENKFSMMTSYCRESEGVNEVPDPYYGGPQGFETVLDLLDDACSGLLGKIKADDPEKF